MPSNLARFQLPPPSNWQDLESLCSDLWRRIWKDPATTKHGRTGQPQHGVDVYGRPDQGANWAGIQCKGKDTLAGTSVTPEELRAEVDKAKLFEPRLSEFFLVTSGPKDVDVEREARTITQQNLQQGWFSVTVLGWPDLLERLGDYEEIAQKHFPDFFVTTQSAGDLPEELTEVTFEILKGQSRPQELLRPDVPAPFTIQPTIPEDSRDRTTPEFDATLDEARDLIEAYNPKQALEHLERLKDRAWSRADAVVKFRLLSNMGAAKLAMKDESAAARLFLEAQQYDPESEKALLNSALGYLILGDKESTRTLSQRVLSRNPASSRAYATLVQVEEEPWDEIVARIPTPYRDDAEVAFALSVRAARLGRLDDALTWVNIALQGKSDPQLEAHKAALLVERLTSDERIKLGQQLSDAEASTIRSALELLDEAWSRVQGTDLQYFKTEWLLNRAAVKRLLGDLDGAGFDLDLAAMITPSDASITLRRASLALARGRREHAIELLDPIFETNREAALLRAQALYTADRYDEATHLLDCILSDPETPEILSDASDLLFHTLIAAGELEKAEQHVATQRQRDPNSVLDLVHAARVARLRGNLDLALSLSIEASTYLGTKRGYKEKKELADELYSLDRYADAAALYTSLVKEPSDTPLWRRLCECLYEAGEREEALRYCKAIHERFGPIRFFAELESSIYEEIGDLEAAAAICRDYLMTHVDDLRMALRLATVHLRRSAPEEAKSFLMRPDSDYVALGLDSALLAAHLRDRVGDPKGAIALLYEARRRYFDDADAHLKYVGFFFFGHPDDPDRFTAAKVTTDTAVLVEESGSSQWYTIEDRPDARVDRYELSLTHDLTARLLGRTTGDTVEIKKGSVTTHLATIREVKSKYLHAFHESLRLFETLFPTAPGLERIDLRKKDSTEGEIDVEPILKTVKDRQTAVNEMLEMYRAGKLTIGALAELSGETAIATWALLSGTPAIGVKCSSGSPDEREAALSALRTEKPFQLVVDCVSLATMFATSATDMIVDGFGALGVAQSTLDLIEHALDREKLNINREAMALSYENGEFIRTLISPENVDSNVRFLEAMLSFSRSKCVVLPVKAALSISKERKNQLDRVIGTSFADTLLLASEPGRVLFSDDERMRTLGRREHGTIGVWTQVLLSHLLTNGKMDRSVYNDLVIRLVQRHYIHTSIDADVLMHAADRASWCAAQPFIGALQLLRPAHADAESAVRVLCNFLFKLWVEPILLEQRRLLTFAAIDVVARERNRERVLEGLRECVTYRFRLLPIGAREVLRMMESWGDSQIVVVGDT